MATPSRMTAATQPSIEDLVLGALPWVPRVRLHNPLLSRENGDEFLAPFRLAAEGGLPRFILVIEGSIPDENNKDAGYWASLGTDPASGQPITTCEWIDRLAPRAWAVVAAGTCAAYGGIHAMAGNPTGAMGLARVSRLGLAIERRASRSSPFRAARCSPTTSRKRCSTCCTMAAGRAPMIPLDEALRPTWLFGQTVHEGCDRGGYYEQAEFGDRLRLPALHREAWLLGSGRAVQRGETRLDGGDRRVSERRRDLHRLHDAGLSGQVHAVHGSATRFAAVVGTP